MEKIVQVKKKKAATKIEPLTECTVSNCSTIASKT